jgi:two-component system OmpR family sensor kinase
VTYPMFHTLYARVAIVLAIIFTLIGIFFVHLMGISSERHQQEVTQRLNRDLAEHIVAEKLLFKNQHIDNEALSDIFHMMMVINPKVEIYLLDPNGKVLAYSAPPGVVQRNQIDLGPIRTFLSAENALPILGDDPRHTQQHKIFSVAPVRNGKVLQGYLYIILASEQYTGIAQMLENSYAMQIGTGMLIAGLIFVLFTALILFALLTRRLRRLSTTMETFKRSGRIPALQYQHGSNSGDEIDRLSATFEDMAKRISEQIAKLRQTDALRRELVANVSHDLRTPLASLQGYLETLMLKDAELSEEEKRNYLDVAMKHAIHLSELVGDLFELAKLEANEVKPHLEPFALQELVQDVIHKFELKARQHDVQLSQHLEKDPPYVFGDIGLIERVLDNLLDNALRHTPRGGSVTVVLTPHENTVSLEVIDTGCGIAPQDMPHIFDRFYAPTKSGHSGTEGTGLGLAIARHIVELHGGAIHASSKLHKGTVFTFDLPVHQAAA